MTRQFFSIIGAQRCCTTWLYHCLESHPQLAMAGPVRPEPKFFLEDFTVEAHSEYVEKYYDFTPETRAFGEKSTTYFERIDSGHRILSVYDDARLIVSLRNPIDRALSNFFFSEENLLETRTLEETFVKQKTAPDLSIKLSTSPFDYLGRGEYIRFLKPYVDLVGKDRIKILFLEEMVSDIEILRDVYGFLGVDTAHTPASFHRRINECESETRPVDEEILRVIGEYFKPWNDQLADYLDVDLDFWGETFAFSNKEQESLEQAC